MSRSLYHDLYVVIPCTLCELSKSYKLLYLAYICCICQAARSAGISKRDCHIVLLTDFKYLIIVLVERIFLSCHAHPCKYKAASTAYDIHLTLVLFNLVYRFSCDSTVKCDKVHSILCMESDYIDKILCCKCCKITLIVDNTVINRHCSYHCRTFACKLLSEWLCIAMA